MTFKQLWLDPWIRTGMGLTVYAILLVGFFLIASYGDGKEDPTNEERKLKVKAKRMKALRTKIKRNRVR